MRIGFVHEYFGSETRPGWELLKAICWNLGQRLNNMVMSIGKNNAKKR
ncbi:MAG: hypothetical protein ACO3AF_07855 [Flavobacteriales bacterium]|jgi:hypothetical protein